MRTIETQGKEVTLDKLVSMVQSKLNMTLDNHPSQYINVVIGEEIGDDYFESTITVRVSNHSAKSKNNNNETISFINDTCDQGYSGMYCDEYVVDNIEEMNTNETNINGWVSVKERLEDFINDLKLEKY